MKKSRKLLSLILALIMLLSLAACGSAKPAAESKEVQSSPASSEAEPQGNEHVTLTMYLLGDRTPDFDQVFDKINARMEEKINATLEIKFLGWGEYEQQYPLLFASDDFDLIYSADWAFYNSQASKQGFYEITKEALEAYAPMTAASMYEDAWEQAKVDGKVYMLPMNYKELTAYVFLVRGDLMDKYGITKLEGIDDLEAYLEAVAKNEPGMIPLDIGSDFDTRFLYDLFWQAGSHDHLERINPQQLMGYVKTGDASATVFNETEDPAFLAAVEKLKDWKDRGFWSKSAAVNTQTNVESFKAGKGAAALLNINNAKGEYSGLIQDHPEWDVRVIDAQGEAPAIVQSYLANGMCIYANSKNPERALMALDLLRNDEEIHDLFCFGIEGVHYTKNADGTITLTEANGNYPYDGNCNWGIRNDAYWKSVAGEGSIPNFQELYDTWIAKARASEFQSFTFNNESVKNQVAAMNDIYTTDMKLLYLGFTSDPAADIAAVQAKLTAAGANEVYAEMTAQAKAWYDSQQG